MVKIALLQDLHAYTTHQLHGVLADVMNEIKVRNTYKVGQRVRSLLDIYKNDKVNLKTGQPSSPLMVRIGEEGTIVKSRVKNKQWHTPLYTVDFDGGCQREIEASTIEAVI